MLSSFSPFVAVVTRLGCQVPLQRASYKSAYGVLKNPWDGGSIIYMSIAELDPIYKHTFV